jgi:bacterioferritin-associated ferredoxin
MIICLCHRVSDRDIADAAQGGCTSFDELQLELSVATSCGKCHDCARNTFQLHAAQAQASKARPDCGALSRHGKLITIAAHHQNVPMAPAFA